MEADLIIPFAILIALASLLGFCAKVLKLPLIIAYILAGFALALMPVSLPAREAISILPTIGIAFLLFLIGMELDLRQLKSLGKPIFITSILQSVVTGIPIFLLSSLLGFSSEEAAYIALALGFSSTIIVVKLFSDRHELTSLSGKLSLGILLVQDLVAVVTLMGLSLRSSFLDLGVSAGYPFLGIIVKGFLLFLVTYLISTHLLPKIFKLAASSQELLFLTGVSTCFVFAATSIAFGFSLEIGAFLGGLALASSPYHFQIAGRIKPLRDLFITVFFVDLGARAALASSQILILPILVFVFWTLIVKPLVFLVTLGGMRFRKHTIFKVSLSLSQISEFSLILVFVGYSSGQVGEGALSSIALTAIITMAVSSVFITKGDFLFRKLGKYLKVFESRNTVESILDTREDLLSGHILLLGCDRTGRRLLPTLTKLGKKVVVVDFNPTIVKGLIAKNLSTLYGDISDPDLLDNLNCEKASLIVSTIGDLEDNLTLLSRLKKVRERPTLIFIATYPEEAARLYEAGADYVVVPNMLSGEHIGELLANHIKDEDYFRDRREKHFVSLTEEIGYSGG